MTVETTVNKSGPYELDGSTLVFDRKFALLDASHLEVWRYFPGGREQILTGFTQTGVGDVEGTVVFSSGAAIASGELMLLRVVPNVQETDYNNQTRVYPETIERDLDLIAMQIQDVREEVGRAFRVPLTASASAEELEELTAAAIRLSEHLDQIMRVNASIDNVDTVAGIDEAVTVVAANVLAIASVYEQIAVIVALNAAIPSIEADRVAAVAAAGAALTSAGNAATSAGEALASAGAASGSAGAAATSAGAAATSAGNALSSAGAAATSAGDAAGSATLAQKWAEDPGAPGGVGTKSAKTHAAEAAASAASIDADKLVPIGMTAFWTGGRAHIPDGWDALDGQSVNRVDFPDLWAKIAAGEFPSVSDANWIGMVGNRGRFSTGDGVTTFRFPDANGKYDVNGHKGVFLRGDGRSDMAVGDILGDAIRNITGGISGRLENPSGAFGPVTSQASNMAVGSGTRSNAPFDASLVVPTADENRPVSMVTVIIMRTRGVFNEVIVPGTGATLGANVFSGTQSIGGDLSVNGDLVGGFKAVNDADAAGAIYKPVLAGGNFKSVTNSAAFEFQAPTDGGVYTMIVDLVNGATAGAVTFTGFAKKVGDDLTLTNGHKFQLFIAKTLSGVTVSVVAMQ